MRLDHQVPGWLRGLLCSALLLGCAPALVAAEDAEPPAVGDTAKDFELESLTDKKISLHELTEEGSVILVVLRGYPGYQCPICSIQVGGLRRKAEAIASAGARVLLVYPGPKENLKDLASEFLKGKTLPDGFELVVDPDYEFTNAYNLRWDAPRETAYPSTFVIDSDNKIVFAKISKTHAGRARVGNVLAAIPK